MIRRDYLLRMIDQCVAALARSLGLLQKGEYARAHTELEQAIRELTGMEASRVSTLSDGELLALLLQGEPTQVLRQKCMLLGALLRRTGDTYTAEGKTSEARAAYLKALNLQLEVLLREGPFELPEFAPRVEALVSALNGEPLPVGTNAALMQYYETLGDYAKAENALFEMLEAEPAQGGLIEFGMQFYQRLLHKSDEALELGNLPRTEVKAGLAELEARRAKVASES